MAKVSIYILAILLSIAEIFAATIITFESDYGVKNIILFIFLLTIFIFWVFIYRFTEPIEFDKKSPLKSITNLITKFMCWIWFLTLLYTFQAVMFISSASSFLTDKLDLLYGLLYLSLIIFGILGLFNSIKLYNKMSGTSEFFKEFIWDIKSGGKK